MTGSRRWSRANGLPLQRAFIEQVVRDHAALRRGETDPEIEAVRAAILIEDVFGITLSDADIDAAVLTDAAAVSALVARLRRAV